MYFYTIHILTPHFLQIYQHFPEYQCICSYRFGILIENIVIYPLLHRLSSLIIHVLHISAQLLSVS